MKLLTSPSAIGLSNPPEAGVFGCDEDEVDHDEGMDGIEKVGNDLVVEKHLW